METFVCVDLYVEYYRAFTTSSDFRGKLYVNLNGEVIEIGSVDSKNLKVSEK